MDSGCASAWEANTVEEMGVLILFLALCFHLVVITCLPIV